MSNFSENLKNIRTLRGLSQKTLAERLRCSSNTISNWEKGAIYPNVDMLEPLCAILEVTPNQLLGWDRFPELDEFLYRKKEIIDKMEELNKQKAEIEHRLKAYAEELNRR